MYGLLGLRDTGPFFCQFFVFKWNPHHNRWACLKVLAIAKSSCECSYESPSVMITRILSHVDFLNDLGGTTEKSHIREKNHT